MILKEFALDPNLIKDWDSCRLFLMPFDIYQGRQLSEFPDLRLWKDLIIKGLDKDRVGPKQRKKIVEYIKSKKNSHTFIKRSSLYKKQQEWLDNCKRENEIKPFNAVVYKGKESEIDNFLSDTDFTPEHPLMSASVGRPICRKVEDLTTHLIPLIDQSKEIIFVDPYFRADKSNYLKPIEKFMKIISRNPKNIKRNKIAFHHNDGGMDIKSRFSPNDIMQKWKEKLTPIVPQDIKLELFIWERKKMHNRYVFTEIMGVQYGHGLGEGTDSLNNEDEITPLDHETYRARREKFNDPLLTPYLIINDGI